MVLRNCRILQGKVDIENGFFQTKNKPVNKGVLNNSGYFLINLKRNGQSKFRIMTMQLAIYLEANNIPALPKGFVLHHINCDTGNNTIDNISLVTPTYNSYCAAKSKDYKQIYLKRKKNGFVQKIKATCSDKTHKIYKSMNKCAQAFTVNVGTISKIVNKKPYYNSITQKNKTFTFCRV